LCAKPFVETGRNFLPVERAAADDALGDSGDGRTAGEVDLRAAACRERGEAGVAADSPAFGLSFNASS